MGTGRLEQKRAIVTGAASGIGRASTQHLAAEGASVLLADIDPEVEAVAEAIRSAGGEATAAIVDVGDDSAVEALVARALNDLGGLDICFANAGILSSIAPILDLTREDWEKMFRVNVFGIVACIRYAGRAMVEAGGGSIICTASVAGLRAAAGPAHYSASKAAVIGLVQTAAFQLGGTGVRINAICPGIIETGMTKPLFEFARAAGKEHKLGQLNPLRRAGTSEEIAHMVGFLAGDESSYVNGQAIAVDGGLSASHPFVPGKMM